MLNETIIFDLTQYQEILVTRSSENDDNLDRGSTIILNEINIFLNHAKIKNTP